MIETTFPDLMSGKKIMYVHGFGSSGQTGTVKLIQQVLPKAEVVAWDMPLHPQEAMDLLRRLCDEQKPDLIIGTSMGGMYTEMLRGYDRICVNPAFQMADTMRENNMMGRQTYQNPRADGVQEFFVDKPLVKEYREITEQCFQGITPEDADRVWGCFGDEDPVVHTFDLFSSHYPHAVHFHGAHRMDDKAFLHGVLPVIRWIDDRQEGRERRIVFIDASTLMDNYAKPLSSLNKAYNLLVANYNVYIVAPAPTNDHESITRLQSWIEKYLSTPAHDHVIFTNQKPLLYGDYYIDACPSDAFMGTTLEFGSDEFKTWEEVITFFERLGGQ